MNTNTKFLTFLLLLNVSAYSQTFQWAKQEGGTNGDEGKSIATDASGNVYITGDFTGLADFDPGVGTFQLNGIGNDFFIQKLDSSGNFIWAKSIGAQFTQTARSIVVDASGNSYITGYFYGTVDFDPGPGTFILSSVDFSDIFILKLDTNGNFLWATNMGNTDLDSGNSLVVDNTGNLFLTGDFRGSVDFDPDTSVFNLISNGGSDVFIQKLNSDGKLEWAKSIGGTGTDMGYSIALDDFGNIYMTGYFTGTADFDPGQGTYSLSSAGYEDIFVEKLDSSGNFVLAKKIGGKLGDVGYSIKVDASENMFIAGYFKDTVDFNPGNDTFILSSAGKKDVFIQKLDKSGNYKWANRLGGVNDDYTNFDCMTMDHIGNIYVTGYFSNVAENNPGSETFSLISAGFTDAFILKINNNGNFIWARQMGSIYSDGGNSIYADASGSILTTGRFQDIADLNPNPDVFNLSSNGSIDVFVQKLKQCAVDPFIYPIACNSYTSPSGKNVWTISGMYKDTVSCPKGCDSVITVNLTILQSPGKTINVTACGGYLSPSGKYVWTNSGTYSDTIPNATGCDSLIIVNLLTTKADTSVTIANATITSNATASTYQWLDCNNSFAPIDGETNKSFSPIADGRYAIKVTTDDCTDTSSCYSIITISVIENSFEHNISFYPNPSSGIFTVDMGDTYAEVELMITDNMGRVIDKSIQKQCRLLFLEINELGGLYFLKLKTENKTAVIKLIKN